MLTTTVVQPELEARVKDQVQYRVRQAGTTTLVEATHVPSNEKFTERFQTRSGEEAQAKRVLEARSVLIAAVAARFVRGAGRAVS